METTRDCHLAVSDDCVAHHDLSIGLLTIIVRGAGLQLDQHPVIGFLGAGGAAGLIVPAITHVALILVPLAPIGLVLAMVGVAVVHARRYEANEYCGQRGLRTLSVFVTWARSAHTRSRRRRPIYATVPNSIDDGIGR
jgi:hypothetical protein